jgi:hypothetical protein
MDRQLEALIATASARAIPPGVAGMAEHVRARHAGAIAVLAYGSALRGENLNDTLIDFYVLTRSFKGVAANPLSRLGCRLAPPNVYYAEALIDGQGLRSKYAVMPLDQLRARVSRRVGNPYFWARFAQAPALVWSADRQARAEVITLLAEATRTMFANAVGVQSGDCIATWVAGFRQTYRTELRSEGPERAQELVEANRAYYESAAALMQDEPAITANWPLRRIAGKLLSIVRLIKAAFTFQGGADYAAWKIARHSGVKIEVTDWQRRHPILAGLMLLPKLLRTGALR